MKLHSKGGRFQYGFTSRCIDGLHVMFLDYDLHGPYASQWVADDIGVLQTLFGCGDAFVFETKNGYHVVFLEKRTISETWLLMERTSADTGHRMVPIYGVSKQWVLRTNNKKGETMTYHGVYAADKQPDLPRSRAHALYLRDYKGVPSSDLRLATDVLYDTAHDLKTAVYHVKKKQKTKKRKPLNTTKKKS